LNQREDDAHAKDAARRKALTLDTVQDQIHIMRFDDHQKQDRIVVKELEALQLEKDLEEKRNMDEEEKEAKRFPTQIQFERIAKQNALKCQIARTKKQKEI
jgi:hypothetical protein